jgi:23S rRNA (guanine1835-N2)-methyltransferase
MVMSELKRYPRRKNETLQAYDAGDELLLKYLQTQSLEQKKILILNDGFGALSCGLSGVDTATYTDSFVSAEGIRLNSGGAVQPFNSLGQLIDSYDCVVMKLPNNLSFFEDLLAHLTARMHPGAQLICAGMVKYMVKSYFDLIHQYIGETTTSLAEKKARLIFAPFSKHVVTSPYPIRVQIDGFIQPFVHHSNLFSREKLDVGTRFFLEHLPSNVKGTLLDLGCGNGVVGIKARCLSPEAKIIFSDQSQMAIDSALINYDQQIGLKVSPEPHFVWTNCFENQPENSLDWVLCNPPFHQQQVVGDEVAWQMFIDSKAALKTGGSLRVIGNSHLGYQAKLKKLFGNSRLVAQNSKFVIVEAQA